jgi:hypothetical protein
MGIRHTHQQLIESCGHSTKCVLCYMHHSRDRWYPPVQHCWSLLLLLNDIPHKGDPDEVKALLIDAAISHVEHLRQRSLYARPQSLSKASVIVGKIFNGLNPTASAFSSTTMSELSWSRAELLRPWHLASSLVNSAG